MNTAKKDFIIKLDQFKSAWFMLNAAWENLEKSDFDLSNVPNKLYPFQSPFDDMVIPVSEWVEDVKSKLTDPTYGS